MSEVMSHAIAQATEPSTNSTRAVMYRRLVPKRSAAQPVTGMTVAKARVYAVIVHATVAYEVSKSSAKVVSATLTTVTSRIDMMAPSTTTEAILRTAPSSLSDAGAGAFGDVIAKSPG